MGPRPLFASVLMVSRRPSKPRSEGSIPSVRSTQTKAPTRMFRSGLFVCLLAIVGVDARINDGHHRLFIEWVARLPQLLPLGD